MCHSHHSYAELLLPLLMPKIEKEDPFQIIIYGIFNKIFNIWYEEVLKTTNMFRI